MLFALAKDIKFNPKNKNWNVNNIKDVMNDLYSMGSNSNCIKGTIVCDTCTSINEQVIVDNFEPSYFIVNLSDASNNYYVFM